MLPCAGTNTLETYRLHTHTHYVYFEYTNTYVLHTASTYTHANECTHIHITYISWCIYVLLVYTKSIHTHHTYCWYIQNPYIHTIHTAGTYKIHTYTPYILLVHTKSIHTHNTVEPLQSSTVYKDSLFIVTCLVGTDVLTYAVYLYGLQWAKNQGWCCKSDCTHYLDTRTKWKHTQGTLLVI